MTSKEVLVNALRQHGYKVTPQRVAVYEALAKCRNHPYAETLYKILQPTHPSMSFATVYKVLEVLKQIGVVRPLDMGEGSTRFDPIMQQHHHVKCVKCGKVMDIFNLQDTALLKEAEQKTGMTLTGEEILFYGICQECK